MRRVLLFVALLAQAALVVPTAAHSQRIPSPYRFVERKQDLGLFVGYLSTDRGSADIGPNSGLVYGLQYTLRLTAPLSFGGWISYFPSERDVIDPTAENAPAVVGSVDQDLLMFAGRLQLNLTGARTWNRIVPYVFGGLGMAISLTGQPSCIVGQSTSPVCDVQPRERFDFGSSLLGQLGIGAAWLPTERLGIRFTLNDNIWRLKTPPGFLDPDAQLDPVPPESDWTNNFQLIASLSFWF